MSRPTKQSSPSSLDTARRRVFIAAALAGLFAGLTVMVVGGWTESVDESWTSTMANAEVAWLVFVAEAFHFVGSPLPVAVTAAVFAIAFFALGQRRLAAAWIVLIASAQLLTTMLKVVIDRSRPANGLVETSTAAYPSGHATVSGAAVAIGLAVLFGLLWPHRYRLLLGIGIVYAAFMAWSRTYLRVHWLTDVIGGLLLGTAVVYLVAWYLVTINRDENRPTPDVP